MSTFEANYLSPQQVRLRRTPRGTVEMTLGAERFPSVRFYLSYPLAEEGKLISVRDALDENQREIGIITDTSGLDPETRNIVEEELAWRYFTPRIQRIVSLREEGIRQLWEVETNRGKKQFTVKDPYEHVRQIADGRLLITDTYECRYEIPDVNQLDKESRELLSRHIYF
jgi:hypothetical protein